MICVSHLERSYSSLIVQVWLSHADLAKINPSISEKRAAMIQTSLSLKCLKSNLHFTIDHFQPILNSYLHIQLYHKTWCKLFSIGIINGFNTGAGYLNHSPKLLGKYSGLVCFPMIANSLLSSWLRADNQRQPPKKPSLKKKNQRKNSNRSVRKIHNRTKSWLGFKKWKK